MITQTRHPRRAAASGTVLAIAALLTAGLVPALAAEPPVDAPAASLLIVSLDSLATDAIDDDVLLDGTTVTIHADDGDAAFDPTADGVAFGPAAVAGGLLDTARLGPGRYWVSTTPPAGYDAPSPILVDLNTDGSMTCVWDAGGLTECQANDAGAEGLSWTMVLVRNAPTATPTATPTADPTAAQTDPTATSTGAVEGTTGRPTLTLPPTDRVGQDRASAAPHTAAWVVLLLVAASASAVWAAWSTRAAAARRRGPRSD